MNQLTRCGLLPTVTGTSSVNYEKKLPVHFGDNIVVPAPFGFRPFAQYHNPYPRGCSVLCNHPVDEETKRQTSLHQSKNLIERKYRIIIEDEVETGGNWQKDIFVPEALFRRYTETDSRPPSPTTTSVVTNATSKILTTQSRRCVTPDPSIHVPEKTQLVLDLRKTASQTALDSNSRLFDENSLSTPWTEKSTNIKNVACKKIDTNKHLTLDKNKSIKQYQGQKEMTNKTVTNNLKQLMNGVPSSPIGKTHQEKKKKPVKRLKSKKKDSKRCSSAATKNGVKNSLQEPNETQISTLDDGSNLNANGEILIDSQIVSIDGDICEDEIEKDTDFDPTHHFEEYMIKRLQKEYNCENLSGDLDAKHLKIFEEMMSKFTTISPLSRPPNTQADTESEVKKLQREFRLNSMIPETEAALNVAGVFSRRNARFELPLDRTSLEGLTPMQYLKAYVHVSKSRLWVYNRVFEMHSNGEELMNVENLFRALFGVLGREFTHEEYNMLMELLINSSNNSQIDFRTWCGICAFCERVFNAGRSSTDIEEDPCHEIETADFEFLERRIRNVNIVEELKKLLFMIRSS